MKEKLLGLFISGCLLVGCAGKVEPPPRPQGVPADAVWAGGVDGGAFIMCSYDSSTRLNKCTVYNDYTGGVEVSGPFKIEGPSSADEVEKFEYSVFDGKRIFLKDGSILTHVPD